MNPLTAQKADFHVRREKGVLAYPSKVPFSKVDLSQCELSRAYFELITYSKLLIAQNPHDFLTSGQCLRVVNLGVVYILAF